MRMVFTVTLTGGTPWGFRLQGGREFNEPIRVAKVCIILKLRQLFKWVSINFDVKFSRSTYHIIQDNNL